MTPSTASLKSITLFGWLKTCPEDLVKHAEAFLLMAAWWASSFLSSPLASQAHLALRASWSSGRWNFFFVITFQSVGWYPSCWNVSLCCVHVRMCRRKKTAERKMCLSRTTHRHESKKQTKRIIHAGAAKKRRNRLTPNPLKISIQGRYSKWWTSDDRDVHYPRGTASARCRGRRRHVL